LAFYQQAADELGGDQLGGVGEEGLGEVLGERGGYGNNINMTTLTTQLYADKIIALTTQ